MADTPESLIKTYNPLMRTNVNEPYIAAGAADLAITVYDETAEPRCDSIFIHNLSVTALKYAKNQDCSDLAFHDILAGGNVANDGLGSKVSFYPNKDGIKKISVYCQSAAVRASVEKQFKRN